MPPFGLIGAVIRLLRRGRSAASAVPLCLNGHAAIVGRRHSRTLEASTFIAVS